MSLQLAPARPTTSAGDRAAIPATAALVVYLVLLTLVPAGLVLPALGAAGTPANVFGIGLLLWWTCAALGHLHRPGPLSPVHLALALFAASVLLAYASGVASGWIRPGEIREETDAVWTLLPITVDELQVKSGLAGLRGLLTLAGWLGVALVLCDGLRTWAQFDLVVTATIWLAAVIGLVGIIQFMTGDNLATRIHIPGLVANTELGSGAERSGFTRVQATANHPIELGVVLAGLFPLALHQALHRGRGWYDYAPMAVLAIAMPMPVSRSGILVLIASFAVLFAGWSANRRAWTLVLLPAVVVAMRGVFPGLIGTIRSLFTSVLYDPSVAGRTSDYGLVLELYGEHPWFGRGAFTFMPKFYRTLDNQFLMSLVELGIVGLLATLWLFLAAIYTARYVTRHSVDPDRAHLGLALCAGLVGIFLSFATFDAWSFSMAAGTTFLLIGLSGAAWRLTRQDMAVRGPHE